jgi:hypothetical protein
MQAVFGAGLLWGTQTMDAYGNAISNPTPIMFGTLQEVSVDISFDTKELYGSQGQFPIFVGRGKGKIDGKAKMGTIKGAVFGNLFFGQGSSNGLISVNYDTVGSVIPATPYQVTITPPSSGVFQNDLGVINKVTGLPLVKVLTVTATNQYSVNTSTGVYTFDSVDAGNTVLINYSYTATSTTAQKNTVINVPMGYAPTFTCELYTPYAGKSLILNLNNCIASKLSLGTKLDDFMIPEFDFSAFADDSGNVLSWSTSE